MNTRKIHSGGHIEDVPVERRIQIERMLTKQNK